MKTEAVSAYLIKNSKGEGGGWSGGRRVGVCVGGGGGGGGGRKAVGKTGRSCMGI